MSLRAAAVPLGLLGALAIFTVIVLGPWTGQHADRSGATGSPSQEKGAPDPQVVYAESLPPERPAPKDRAPALSVERTRATRPAPDPETDPVQGVLFGRLLDSDGGLLEEPVNLRFVDSEGNESYSRGSNGRYAVSGLRPGRWRVRSQAFGYRALDESVVVQDSSPARRDLTLVRSVVLRIRLVTPDGRPFSKAAQEVGTRGLSVVPVATMQRPGDRFHETRGSKNNPFGVGSFWENGFVFGRMPDEYVGVIELRTDLPVYVSAVFGHEVLKTLYVPPGEDEISFELAPEELESHLSSLRLAVVDEHTGKPLSGVSVLLAGASEHTSTTTGDDGGVVLERRVPGRFRLRVQVDGYASIDRTIDLEPGTELDLGVVALGQEVTLAGVARSTSGEPVLTELICRRLDPATGLVDPDWSETARTDASGVFSFSGLTGAVYLLRTYGEDEHSPALQTRWVSGVVPVDARADSVTNLELELAPAVALRLLTTGTVDRSVRFEVEDTAGHTVRSGAFYSSGMRELKLPPGEYRVQVTDAARTLLSRTVQLVDETVTISFGG